MKSLIKHSSPILLFNWIQYQIFLQHCAPLQMSLSDTREDWREAERHKWLRNKHTARSRTKWNCQQMWLWSSYLLNTLLIILGVLYFAELSDSLNICCSIVCVTGLMVILKMTATNPPTKILSIMMMRRCESGTGMGRDNVWWLMMEMWPA